MDYVAWCCLMIMSNWPKCWKAWTVQIPSDEWTNLSVYSTACRDCTLQLLVAANERRRWDGSWWFLSSWAAKDAKKYLEKGKQRAKVLSEQRDVKALGTMHHYIFAFQNSVRVENYTIYIYNHDWSIYKYIMIDLFIYIYIIINNLYNPLSTHRVPQPISGPLMAVDIGRVMACRGLQCHSESNSRHREAVRHPAMKQSCSTIQKEPYNCYLVVKAGQVAFETSWDCNTQSI